MNEEFSFEDLNQRDNKSLEQRIVADLWAWWASEAAPRETNWSPQSPFALSLEFYLCGLFHWIPLSRSGGWWCDGVTELSLPEFAPTRFQFLGVAYVMNSGPCFLAPFELEFHFQEVHDQEPLHVVLKIGNRTRPLIPCRNDVRHGIRVLENRPRRNRDWTIAVTLTSEES